MLLVVSTVSANTTIPGQFSNRDTAIGERDTAMNTAQVLAQLGGGFFACSLFIPEDVPATVNGKMGKYRS